MNSPLLIFIFLVILFAKTNGQGCLDSLKSCRWHYETQGNVKWVQKSDAGGPFMQTECTDANMCGQMEVVTTTLPALSIPRSLELSYRICGDRRMYVRLFARSADKSEKIQLWEKWAYFGKACSDEWLTENIVVYPLRSGSPYQLVLETQVSYPKGYISIRGITTAENETNFIEDNPKKRSVIKDGGPNSADLKTIEVLRNDSELLDDKSDETLEESGNIRSDDDEKFYPPVSRAELSSQYEEYMRDLLDDERCEGLKINDVNDAPPVLLHDIMHELETIGGFSQVVEPPICSFKAHSPSEIRTDSELALKKFILKTEERYWEFRELQKTQLLGGGDSGTVQLRSNIDFIVCLLTALLAMSKMN